MREYPESNCVFDLLKYGLVVIEHPEDKDNFTIVRPASLAGSAFRGWESNINVGTGRVSLSTNAPPALLQPSKNGWLVDISCAAAPGPGPVWFHEEFATARDAVEAIVGCFFGSRVNNENESLQSWYGKRRK
jgi:hypothetical protein